MQNIEPQIIDIIRRHMELSEEIEPDTNLLELGIDSITFVDIVLDLEEVFGFIFDVDKLVYELLKNVSVIKSYIIQKVSEEDLDND